MTGRKTQLLPVNYAAFIDDVKRRVRAAQVRAVTTVNRELVSLYWEIGRDVLKGSKGKGGALRSSIG